MKDRVDMLNGSMNIYGNFMITKCMYIGSSKTTKSITYPLNNV